MTTFWSVALVTAGAEGSIDTTTINDPIVGFVFGQKGLMYNLTLEGSKFINLDRQNKLNQATPNGGFSVSLHIWSSVASE